MKWFKDWFTERDGESWCLGRALGAAGAVEMFWKYATASAPDHVGFATGLAAIIAAVAAKNWSERQ